MPFVVVWYSCPNKFLPLQGVLCIFWAKSQQSTLIEFLQMGKLSPYIKLKVSSHDSLKSVNIYVCLLEDVLV